jgi:hypothetical protein
MSVQLKISQSSFSYGTRSSSVYNFFHFRAKGSFRKFSQLKIDKERQKWTFLQQLKILETSHVTRLQLPNKGYNSKILKFNTQKVSYWRNI